MRKPFLKSILLGAFFFCVHSGITQQLEFGISSSLYRHFFGALNQTYRIDASDHPYSSAFGISEGIHYGRFYFGLTEGLHKTQPVLHSYSYQTVIHYGSVWWYEHYSYTLDYAETRLAFRGGVEVAYEFLQANNHFHFYVGATAAGEKAIKREVTQDAGEYIHTKDPFIVEDSTYKASPQLLFYSKPLPFFSGFIKAEYRFNDYFGVNAALSYINFFGPVFYKNYHYNRNGIGLSASLSYFPAFHKKESGEKQAANTTVQ